MHSPTATARPGLASHPAYAALVQFPAVCFTGALIADIAYWHSTTFLWSIFSLWLLTAGCMMAVLAGIAGALAWVRLPHVRSAPFAVFHVMLSGTALALSILNTVVHSREGYTAVVPLGITLSAAVVVLMLLATWFGWPRDDASIAVRPSGAR